MLSVASSVALLALLSLWSGWINHRRGVSGGVVGAIVGVEGVGGGVVEACSDPRRDSRYVSI